MDEATIKAEVLNLIRRQSQSRRRPVVATEFQILGGQTRADLVIMDKEFVGVEIKSQRDSLKRLVKQANDYRNCFDRTILVLDGSHLVNYLSIDLKFCDVWTFNFDGTLRLFSEGSHEKIPDENLYLMLTLKERELAFRDPAFKNLTKREIFFFFFRKKFGDTSKEFWDSVKGRKIRKADISLLSRFRIGRNATMSVASEHDKMWQDWLKAQSIEY